MNSTPIAVLIADIHYNITTLEVADKATRMAIRIANDLEVPLVVAGDLHDSKANLRGECVKAMMGTFKLCKITPFVLVGNHCKINEKSEEHSLEFLRPYVNIVDKPVRNLIPYWTFIPYQHDLTVMRAYLKTLPDKTNIIMHQGIQGAMAGHYFVDSTALAKDELARFRVISGHYHARSDVYIGNPYTLGFGEANDPEKGFQILCEDGSLHFVSTGLRRHRIWSVNADLDFSQCPPAASIDPVWIKVSGSREALATITKEKVAAASGVASFKLDLIPSEAFAPDTIKATADLSQADTLDGIIDNLTISLATRQRLKDLWKRLATNEST